MVFEANKTCYLKPVRRLRGRIRILLSGMALGGVAGRCTQTTVVTMQRHPRLSTPLKFCWRDATVLQGRDEVGDLPDLVRPVRTYLGGRTT